MSPSDLKQSAPIDIHRVRNLFASPARVRESDFLRREIASRMHERLALVKIAPQRILDAGCGEGSDFILLQNRFADAHLLGIDGAEQMLALARERHLNAQSAQSAVDRFLAKWLPYKTKPAKLHSRGMPALLCGDFACLPLAGNTVDLIWSNLALHWHPQPDRVFAEWVRVLRVDGLLMFTCFGPDSFKEVRAAFAGVDHAMHVLPFVDMHDLGDMLAHAGFSTPVMDMETITVTYASVEKLMADARAWGGNPLLTRRRGLLGRGAWAKVTDAFERMRKERADGRIPLTFEIIYGHAFKPMPKTTAAGEAIIRFSRQK